MPPPYGHLYRVVQDAQGNLVTEVLGTIKVAGTSTLATLYGDADGAATLPNPLTNSATYASYSVWLAAGHYDIDFVKSGYTFESQTDIQIPEPTGGVTQLLGSTNRVLVSPAGGTGIVTLSTPQDLAPDSSLQFGHLGVGTPAPTSPTLLSVNGQALVSSTLTAQTFYAPNNAVGDDVLGIRLNVSATGGTNRWSIYSEGDAPSRIAGTLDAVGDVLMRGKLGVGNISPGTNTLLVNGPALLNNTLSVGPVASPTLALVVDADGLFRGKLGLGNLVPGADTLLVNGTAKVNQSLSIGPVTSPGLALAVDADGLFRGKLGIGNVLPGAFTLNVNGSAGNPGGVWSNTSSFRRLKRHLRPLTGALATLLQLQGQQWEWTEEQRELEALLPGTQTGLVLEEVAAVLPQWITPGPAGPVGYSERGSLAYVIESLREIVTRLEILEAAVPAGP